MINIKTFKKEPTDLEIEIKRLLVVLENLQPADDDYATVADQLVKLYKLKEVDSKRIVSPDALVNAATSLIGILAITNYEYTHALTSKALSFVVKSK